MKKVSKKSSPSATQLPAALSMLQKMKLAFGSDMHFLLTHFQAAGAQRPLLKGRILESDEFQPPFPQNSEPKASRFRNEVTRSFGNGFQRQLKNSLEKVPFLLLRFLWASKENEERKQKKQKRINSY